MLKVILERGTDIDKEIIAIFFANKLIQLVKLKMPYKKPNQFKKFRSQFRPWRKKNNQLLSYFINQWLQAVFLPAHWVHTFRVKLLREQS